MIATSIQDWNIFKRVPRADEIVRGLKRVPSHWSLTPLQDKQPKRKGWEKEPFIAHQEIVDFILQGEKLTSQKGNPYTRYWSGFGLRTGEPSGGSIAIDIDGPSAQPLLDAISGGDLPKTVSWSSGKPGRSQILFQIPEQYRQSLSEFTRVVLTEWNGLKTDGKELLEFRYNGAQSVLPPSRHPETGSYHWINAPDEIPVAIAPVWLCDLLLFFADKQAIERKQQQEAAARQAVQWAEHKKEYEKTGIATDLVSFLEYEVLPRLSPEQIFNWSGHNFRQFGQTWKGCPPWRQSSSGTSFHVWWDGQKWAWQDKATTEGGGAIQYRWKLRGGTGTPKGKDFVEIVEELAIDAGVSMPPMERRTVTEPNGELYEQYIELEQLEEIIARAEDSENFRQFFSYQLENFQKFFTRSSAIPPKAKPIITNDDGVLEFEPGEHQALLMKLGKEAAKNDRKIRILDLSEMGAGKSHVVGELSAELLGCTHSFYCSIKHRNPTVAGLEKRVDIPTRHDGKRFGLYRDDSKLTPLGNPSIHRVKSGMASNVAGNCLHTEKFFTYRHKGYQDEVDETAQQNKICKSCEFTHLCQSGGSYNDVAIGYRGQKYEVLNSETDFRGNLDSIPQLADYKLPVLDDEGKIKKPGKRVVLFIDETDQLRQASLVEATLADLDRSWMRLQQQLKDKAATYDRLLNNHNLVSHQLVVLKEKYESTKQRCQELVKLKGTSSSNQEIEARNKEHLHLSDRLTAIALSRQELEKEARAISTQLDLERSSEEYATFRSIESALSTIEPIVFGLRKFLAGEIKTTQETYYGWNELHLRQALGLEVLDEDIRIAIANALTTLIQLNPRLEELIANDTVNLKDIPYGDRKNMASIENANKLLREQTRKETSLNFRELPVNWLVPMLEIILSGRGSFRITSKRLLCVMVPDTRYAEQLKEADFLWIADATADPQEIADLLDIDRQELVVIRQKRSDYSNLTIYQVSGLGLLGKGRSQTKKSQVAALKKAIFDKHGADNVGVIDHLSEKDTGEGHWFFDSRGSNEYQHKNAMLLLGEPYQDIGYLAMLYTMLMGDRYTTRENSQFDDFVRQKKQIEVIQACGRLRSNRRQDHITLYIATESDLSYLHDYFPGAKFERCRAAEIAIEAGSRGEQIHHAIFQAGFKLLQEGVKLTAQTVGELVNRSQERISQIVRKLCGGFKRFKKILEILYDSLYRSTNNFSRAQEDWKQGLDEDEIFLVEKYVPLIIEEVPHCSPEESALKVINMATECGIQSYQRVVRALPLRDRALLLLMVIGALPREFHQNFLHIVENLVKTATNTVVLEPNSA